MEKKKYKPQMDYAKKSVKQIKIDLVRDTNPDIIAKLESVPNIAGYIKKLIRDDIAKNK